MSEKILFIDRDGTLIVEPEDKQIDSLEKLEFVPLVFSSLSKIADSGVYELVMISNQDGLGTDSFPETDFWPAHNKVLKALEGEGVVFSNILIDPSLPEENSPNRKPNTGMVEPYLEQGFDKENSYVIGDRLSDVQLASNMGCGAILINDGSLKQELKQKGLLETCSLITTSWKDISKFLLEPPRTALTKRQTN